MKTAPNKVDTYDIMLKLGHIFLDSVQARQELWTNFQPIVCCALLCRQVKNTLLLWFEPILNYLNIDIFIKGKFASHTTVPIYTKCYTTEK